MPAFGLISSCHGPHAHGINWGPGADGLGGFQESDVSVVKEVVEPLGMEAVGNRSVGVGGAADAGSARGLKQSSDTPPGAVGPGPAQKEGQSLPAMFRPLASSARRMVPAGSLTWADFEAARFPVESPWSGPSQVVENANAFQVGGGKWGSGTAEHESRAGRIHGVGPPRGERIEPRLGLGKLDSSAGQRSTLGVRSGEVTPMINSCSLAVPPMLRWM